MSTVDELRWIDGVEDGREVSAAGPAPSSAALDERGRDQRQAHALRLAGRFVEQVIHDAIDARRRWDPSAPDLSVDWDALWASGTGSSSVAQAVGRVVVAAENLAHDIAEGRATPRRAQSPPLSPRPSHVPGPRPREVVHPTRETWQEDATSTGLVGSRAPVGPVEGADSWPAPPLPSRAGGVTPHPPADVTLAPLALRPALVQPLLTPAEGLRNMRALRRQRLATVFAWVRNAGIALILFAGWQLWGTSLAQHQAQQSLHQQFTSRVRQATPSSARTAGPTLVSADARLPEPAQGSVVAHLRIPAIGVDQYVVEGTAEGDLQKGPGHYVGTAMPGQAGNVAIAGHRTTYGAPFNNLDKMAPGDEIDLATVSGMNLDYVVTQPPVPVAPSDVKILNSFGDNRLTLTTCNPRYSATQRLVVVALLRGPVGASTAASPASSGQPPVKPRPVTSGGSVGWNLAYLPGVLAVLAFVMFLGLANRRAAVYYGRRGRWLILVPIWLAATYVLFGLLSSLVPATL